MTTSAKKTTTDRGYTAIFDDSLQRGYLGCLPHANVAAFLADYRQQAPDPLIRTELASYGRIRKEQSYSVPA